MHFPHRRQCVSLRPIRVLLGGQVGFKYRRKHQYRGRLHHPVAYRGNTDGPQLSIRLLQVHPPDRLGSIRLLPEGFRQSPKPALYPVRLNVLETFLVHARRPLVGFAAGVGVLQNVSAVYLVVEEVEPILGLFLRFGM
jgi:hypothetical protein